MSLFYRIIYATHANGTHHKLALDALLDLNDENAETWQRLFLKDAELFMTGAKAPDKEFKDFKNHVLHPGDEYWGGAPGKARNWYDHLVQALKDENWSEAVWCAGVLSHYYTDPIMPFHTAQSDAENQIHRAVEWSINRSYNDLRAEGLALADTSTNPIPSKGTNWLEDFVCEGADTSHEYYKELIAHYDFEAGVAEPTRGLKPNARKFVSALLLYASSGFARILDRAFQESGATPPEVSLTAETVLSALEIPIKWVTNKIADEAERRAVQAMYDELHNTGEVEQTLPEDDRAVRSLYRAEVLPKKAAAQAKARKRKLTTSQEERRTSNNWQRDAKRTEKPAAEPRIIESSPAVPKVSQNKSTTTDRAQSQPREKPIYLDLDDDLEKAPAIGPKTAKRLATQAGLKTVRDLLAADPEKLAKKLNHRFMNAKTVRNWQSAARLVTEVPGLRGTYAMLLTCAGVSTSEALAKTDSETLAAALLHYSLTPEGSRMLRNGKPPDINKVKDWIDAAQFARAA